MRLRRKLTWDTATEMFLGDAEANARRRRGARKPEYDFERVLSQAGLA